MALAMALVVGQRPAASGRQLQKLLGNLPNRLVSVCALRQKSPSVIHVRCQYQQRQETSGVAACNVAGLQSAQNLDFKSEEPPNL